MKLTHISVEGVGRFAQAVTVRDIAPGLNVLAAPNEAGKSTLFQAVRACVFEKHTAKHDEIRALAGGPAGAPVTIELGFEQGGAHYVARKSFLHAPRAILLKDGREIAAGRTADEMLHEILGLRPASGRSMDEGALGLLWVGQTQSFEPPQVDGQARDSISSAIEREVGDLAGGERARAMLKEVEERLKIFLTTTGAVARQGPLGRAETALQDVEARLAEETGLLAELERDIATLERLRRERDAHDAPGAEADLRARLAESAGALTQARAALEQMRGLAKDEELARRALEQAQAAFAEAQSRARRIDQTRATLAAAQEELVPLDAQAQECAQALAEIRAARETLDENDARLAAQDAHLRKLAAAAEAAAKTPALAARLAQLEALASEIEAATQARTGLQISNKTVRALEACEREAALLRDRLAAAAPQVEITPAPDARERFRIDDKSIEGPRAFALTQPLRVEAPGLGAISLSPPPQFGEDERTRLRELSETRVRLLETLNARDLAQARERLERAEALDRALATNHARLAAFDCAPADLAKTLSALRAQIVAAQASVRETLGADAQPDPRDIAAKREALEARRAQDRQERLRLQARESAQQELRADIAERRAAARTRLTDAQAALAADLAALPDETRAQTLAAAGAALGAARATHESSQLALEAARASAPDAQRLTDLEARAQRYGDALAEHQRRTRAIADEMSRIEGALSVRGGGGLGERVISRREERDLALAEVERLRAQVAALRRLRDVIAACYQEQREKLQTPLRRCLQPYLDDLFPQAQVTLDEAFRVESLTRAGAGEAFTQLSGGTREQIAVLVRLAMGALLQERGEEAPIILDDALVFCDDERIERMFDALNRAARRQQVIVLTCRTRGSRTLGGRSLRIEPLEAPLR
jgi:DNA repair exonuclease SbcCD ATPase subunit